VDTETQAAWDYLVSQWGTAYIFSCDPARAIAYAARRRDNGLELQARSVESLQNLIRKDYAERAVSREVAP
jgi:hypothetical protein